MSVLFQVNCINSYLIQGCKLLVISGIKDGKMKKKCSYWILGLLWLYNQNDGNPCVVARLKED